MPVMPWKVFLPPETNDSQGLETLDVLIKDGANANVDENNLDALGSDYSQNRSSRDRHR